MARWLPVVALSLGPALCSAADPPATPPMTGPLNAPRPNPIGGESIPGLTVNGIVSGLGLAADDGSTRAALTNGQVFVQSSAGWCQFFVAAGAYEFPALGLPLLSAEDTVRDLYGPVPIAYLKLMPAKNTSVLIGALPGLVGVESPFTFQNMNVQRGLLWNQENTINRGVQVNQTIGKIAASLSWNDGYYSNRYSWLSGSLTYASGAHSLSFQAMGSLSQTAFRTAATPVQNNGRVYVAAYTYSQGRWIVQPYFQYTGVSASAAGGSTRGGALLVSRSLGRGFALAGRGEYLDSAGHLDLLYGAGSGARSATVTPTFQRGRVFVRGDLAVVRFRRAGAQPNQTRAVIEAGLLF